MLVKVADYGLLLNGVQDDRTAAKIIEDIYAVRNQVYPLTLTIFQKDTEEAVLDYVVQVTGVDGVRTSDGEHPEWEFHIRCEEVLKA